MIKPDIVFFGEDLPERFFNNYKKDFAKCDLLIILGTSLAVDPFADLASEVKPSAPRVLINRDVIGPFAKRKRRNNDVVVKGDILEGVEKLATILSWKKDLDDIIKEGEDKFNRKFAESSL